MKAKYSGKMSTIFTELFNYLPLCYVINGKVFVSHFTIFSRALGELKCQFRSVMEECQRRRV